MKNTAIGLTLLVLLAIVSAALFMRASDVRQTRSISLVYQKDVQAGRLSPSAARSLSPNAPLVNAMDEYVTRVEAARRRINQMPVTEKEKRRLIRLEMSHAAQDWKRKLSPVSKASQ